MSLGPPPTKQRYNHELPGVYGQFGTGAGVHAFYLQSALKASQLSWVSLISEIRGSEQWPVRDLFQRDVDNDRITDSLLPYLQNTEKIKFFNPLTLTLLPIHEEDDRVLARMPRVRARIMSKDGHEWNVLERPHYHRVRWVTDHPQYAVLEWDAARTKLVAIDGQHRLSALKRFWSDYEAVIHQDFRTWHIPVVIVSFRVSEGQDEPPRVLDVIRNIFVYINTEAKRVNRARQILLSDESVNSVCTQELIQRSHVNDLRNSPDLRRLPLLFFDWRGEESGGRRVHAPASVKGVEEICAWFEYYVLGEDFSEDQEIALGINPVHELRSAFHFQKLNHTHTRLLRGLVQQELLPAVSYLLENFVPYRSYIAALRALEREYEQEEQNDLSRHAFYELRFGTNLAPESVKENVQNVLTTIKDRIDHLKVDSLHSPINLDIGMRGVICAFGRLHRSFVSSKWMDFAKWFTRSLNHAYTDGWLDLRPNARRRKYLLHIAQDHNETVVNYRLRDADAALGAYLQLLVGAYGQPLPEAWTVSWTALKENILDRLAARLLRGFKKEVRPQLRSEYPDGGRPLTKAVNRMAAQKMRRQLRRFERQLEMIEKRVQAD